MPPEFGITRPRTLLLGGTILCEGLALMLFSQMQWLPLTPSPP